MTKDVIVCQWCGLRPAIDQEYTQKHSGKHIYVCAKCKKELDEKE